MKLSLRILTLTTLLVGATSCLPDLCGTELLRKLDLPASDKVIAIFTVDCGATTQTSHQVSIVAPDWQISTTSRGNIFITNDMRFDETKDVYWSDNLQSLVIKEGDTTRTFLRLTEYEGVPITYTSVVDTTVGTTLPTASSTPPATITRSILQDTAGDTWIAAFDGVFRYDGTTFTNVMEGVSASRFFSALEDSKGTLWFGSIGSGVYAYDGHRFQNYTTLDGLLNNEVTAIHEDGAGRIWFGVNGGVSSYDGTSFQNYVLKNGRMDKAQAGQTIPDMQRPPSEVTALAGDRSGNVWVATRGHTFVYDGRTFTTARRPDGEPFKNVRSIIADERGNIWLGGQDGLWRYADDRFTNFTRDFVGYVYADKDGNIWTSSEIVGENRGWTLSRYAAATLSAVQPAVQQIESPHAGNEGMLFGISEAQDGSIWFGGLDGVYRWDGDKVEGFTDTLEAAYRVIADDLTGKLGVSALHIESGKTRSFNGGDRFPMQSVYKFPIAMVMLQEIDAGRYALTDSVAIDPKEYIPTRGHSPIRDQFPNGVTLTIAQILEYNVSQSDGTACDVLLRLLGGTEAVNRRVHAFGVTDIAIATTEMVQVANDTIQYQNWTTPEAMSQLLAVFHSRQFLSDRSYDLLAGYMTFSNRYFDKRIKQLLPAGTPVIHKTGTAGTIDGLTRATNDVGIITLPDGSHLAVSVFISDSRDVQIDRELAIARAAKASYEYWVGN